MAINKLLFFTTALFMLLGCSEKDYSKIKTISKTFQDRGKQILEIKSSDIENVNYPIIEVRSNDVIKRVLMIPISTRNNYTYYSNGGSQALTLNGSIISKTIGFNSGLISLETEENSPLIVKTKLSDWPKQSSRKYSFITHLNSKKSFIFECIVKNKKDDILKILDNEIKLIKIEEYCSNNLFSFENVYWSYEDGSIKKTTQRVSNKDIYLTVTFLK